MVAAHTAGLREACWNVAGFSVGSEEGQACTCIGLRSVQKGHVKEVKMWPGLGRGRQGWGKEGVLRSSQGLLGLCQAGRVPWNFPAGACKRSREGAR